MPGVWGPPPPLSPMRSACLGNSSIANARTGRKKLRSECSYFTHCDWVPLECGYVGHVANMVGGWVGGGGQAVQQPVQCPLGGRERRPGAVACPLQEGTLPSRCSVAPHPAPVLTPSAGAVWGPRDASQRASNEAGGLDLDAGEGHRGELAAVAACAMRKTAAASHWRRHVRALIFQPFFCETVCNKLNPSLIYFLLAGWLVRPAPVPLLPFLSCTSTLMSFLH